jgi:hypothetical protein
MWVVDYPAVLEVVYYLDVEVGASVYLWLSVWLLRLPGAVWQWRIPGADLGRLKILGR